MSLSTSKHRETLLKLMQEQKLTSESKFIRYTTKQHLIEEDGNFYLKAKDQPIEMLIDVYDGNGEVFIASGIGPGIAVLTQREAEYEQSDRICVEIQLKDVLDQGGLIYEVTSLPAYLTSYFFTLPTGSVMISVGQ